MSAQTVIDSLEFARAAQALRGSLPLTSFARLQDCLFDTAGGVEFTVTGGRDDRQRLILNLEINGLLDLRCQCCLGLLNYPLQIFNTLRLVRKGEDLGAEADDPEAADCIETSPELDVVSLLEDEILLSLPFAPRHAENGCRSLLNTGQREAAWPSSFAKLAALKKI